jgi:ferredoxin-NADP reductase
MDFIELEVKETIHLAEDVIGVTLASPTGARLPSWRPGAHIDITLPSKLIRSYSLCGSPDQPEYKIAVLHERSGRGGSREIHQTPLVGKSVLSSIPKNDFELAEAAHYVFIAGGIGITPLLPMLREVAVSSATWELHYLGRSRAAMAFLAEILPYRNFERGKIHVVARDEHERAHLPVILGDARQGSAVYCCGPNRLLAEVEGLATQSADKYSLHIERFGRPDLGRSDPRAEALDNAGDSSGETELPCDPDGSFQVELRKTGVVLDIGPKDTILGSARKIRQGLSFSCSDGYCGTCETKVIAGKPDHRDAVLSDEEKERNTTMMICVGRSRTRRLILDL